MRDLAAGSGFRGPGRACAPEQEGKTGGRIPGGVDISTVELNPLARVARDRDTIWQDNLRCQPRSPIPSRGIPPQARGPHVATRKIDLISRKANCPAKSVKGSVQRILSVVPATKPWVSSSKIVCAGTADRMLFVIGSARPDVSSPQIRGCGMNS